MCADPRRVLFRSKKILRRYAVRRFHVRRSQTCALPIKKDTEKIRCASISCAQIPDGTRSLLQNAVAVDGDPQDQSEIMGYTGVLGVVAPTRPLVSFHIYISIPLPLHLVQEGDDLFLFLHFPFFTFPSTYTHNSPPLTADIYVCDESLFLSLNLYLTCERCSRVQSGLGEV